MVQADVGEEYVMVIVVEAVQVHLTDGQTGLLIPGSLHVGGVDIELCAFLGRNKGHPVVFQGLAAGGGGVLHRLTGGEFHGGLAADLLGAAGAVVACVSLDTGARGKLRIDDRVRHRTQPIHQKYRLAAEVLLAIRIAVIIAIHIGGHHPRPVFPGGVVGPALLGGAVHMEISIFLVRHRLLSHFLLIGQQDDLCASEQRTVLFEYGKDHAAAVIGLVSGAEQLGGNVGLAGRFLQSPVIAHIGGDIGRGVAHLRAVMVVAHGEEVRTINGDVLLGNIFPDVVSLGAVMIAGRTGINRAAVLIFQAGIAPAVSGNVHPHIQRPQGHSRAVAQPTGGE